MTRTFALALATLMVLGGGGAHAQARIQGSLTIGGMTFPAGSDGIIELLRAQGRACEAIEALQVSQPAPGARVCCRGESMCYRITETGGEKKVENEPR